MSDDHLLDQWGQLMDPTAPMPTVQLGRRGFLGALAGGVAALAMSRGAGSPAAAQAPAAAPIPPTPAAVPMVKVKVPHSVAVEEFLTTEDDAEAAADEDDEESEYDYDEARENAFEDASMAHDDIRAMAGEELHEMGLTPEEINQIRDGNTEFVEHDSGNISHADAHYHHELIMPKDLYEKRFRHAWSVKNLGYTDEETSMNSGEVDETLGVEDFNPLAEMEAAAKEYAGEAPAADWTKQLAGAASQLIKKIPDHVDRMARTGNGLGDAFKSFMDDSIKRQAVHGTLRGDEPTRAADRQTRDLDQLLLQHATPLPDDLVVFRPIDRERVGLRDDSSAVGKHLADRSYLSATSDPDRAAELSKQTGAVMAVHLPKGTPVLHHNGDVLLPRGTRLRVTGHDQASDGTHLLTAKHEEK